MSIFLNEKISHFIYLNEVSSTNEYAFEITSKSNPLHDYAIFSSNQRQGKGQNGRIWYSGTHKNISLSITASMNGMKASWMSFMNMWLALSIQSYLEDKVPNKEIHIKWPNDIYINDNKICGILVRSQIAAKNVKQLIIGIGINVNEKDFPAWIPNPTSLYIENQIEYNLLAEIHNLINSFDQNRVLFSQKNFIQIKQRYNESLYLKGVKRRFKNLKTNTLFDGQIMHVDEIGQLVIKSKGNLFSYKFQEISF